MKRAENGKLPISIAIITRDEERNLPECLESVAFADDVVVVDSGSTDKTAEIARSFGARVFIEPWQGFSGQKQSAVDHCKHDWVFILDADERIPRETAGHIAKVLRDPPPDAGGFSLSRKNFFHGKWIKTCGWWPNRVLRLVDRRKGAFDGRHIHESWVTGAKVTELDCAITHFSFRDYSELITRLEHYTNIGARDQYEQGKKTGAFKAIGHGMWMFFKVYFLEQGFRDGFDGLVISLMHGAGSFFKYAKHLEMRQYNVDAGTGRSKNIS